MKTAAVITVTTGKRPKELEHCIASIANQTYPCQQYILCDGDFNRFAELKRLYPQVLLCYWDAKIGGAGLEGRRWLAAAPHMVNEDVTFFCNDDDWYEENHVQTIMEKIEEGNDWAYSFRKIFDKEGNFLFLDNCEALGEASPVWNIPDHHFVDWCMWGMKTECLKQISAIFSIKGYGVDRLFYNNARQIFPKFVGTNLHTFCFRLGGNEYSVSKEFFVEGNKRILEKFNGKLPWILT
jgi:glycosyltransferase involved in cell wall biosynthesis